MFKRVIEIDISSKSGKSVIIKSDSNNEQLKIDVNGKKYIGGERSVFNVIIYNLDPYDRAALSSYENTNDELNIIDVKAGFEDDYIDTIFNGSIIYRSLTKQGGTTTITQLTCVVGNEFIEKAVVAKTFASGTNYYDIANHIAKDSSEYMTFDISDKLKELELQQDLSLQESSYTALEDIAEENKLSFVIEDNNTIKIADLYNQSSYIIVSEANGMIDYPNLSTEGLDVNVICSPKYKIGGLIYIDNADVNVSVGNAKDLVESSGIPGLMFSSDGIYIVYEMDYSLTNRGNDFKINLKCYSKNLYYTYELEEASNEE